MAIKPEKHQQEDNRDEEGVGEEVLPSSSSKHKKVQYMILAGVAVALVTAIWFINGKSEEGTKETNSLEVEQIEGDTEDGTISSDLTDSSKPWESGESGVTDIPIKDIPSEGNGTGDKDSPVGIKDISKDSVKVNPHPISNKEMTKTFTGGDVPVEYRTNRAPETTVDFVSYKLYRSTVSPGVELYWMDAEYKGQKAIITVPYKIAKEMDPVGVTVVDVETTEIITEAGEYDYIITGFTVRTDYKQLLEGR